MQGARPCHIKCKIRIPAPLRPHAIVGRYAAGNPRPRSSRYAASDATRCDSLHPRAVADNRETASAVGPAPCRLNASPVRRYMTSETDVAISSSHARTTSLSRTYGFCVTGSPRRCLDRSEERSVPSCTCRGSPSECFVDAIDHLAGNEPVGRVFSAGDSDEVFTRPADSMLPRTGRRIVRLGV